MLPAGVADATVLLEDGVIAAVLEGRVAMTGVRAIDAGDRIVMPGIIDPHVHINEPGRTEWEGFETATRAALAGGITSLIEMPLNASPVTTTGRAFEQKLGAAAGKLHCDCGFWGGIVPATAGAVLPFTATDIAGTAGSVLADMGVFGFKAFLTHSGIDEFPNVTESDLRIVMPVISRMGLPLLVHCELEGPVEASQTDVRSYRQYLASRPRKWENDAIGLMIRLCAEYRCAVHIVHLSSSDALPAIRRAKERGLPLTVETAQHYLYFAAEEIADGEPAFKCAPPIREVANRDMLWQALEEGLIDFVATDHSPAPPALKQIGAGDLQRAWGGIASLQLALPVLWTAARARGLAPGRLVKWLCEGPARLTGLGGLDGGGHSRGRIEPGCSADLVVWDPEKSFEVRGAALYHRHPLTPYEGRTLYGVVEQTWLRGRLCFDGGEVVDSNQGKILLRGAESR